MIVKVNQEKLNEILSEFWVPATSCYQTGYWTDGFFPGRLTISIKCGKKRKLVAGKLVWRGHESSQTSSGYDILQFVPNNENKLKQILTKIKQ